MPATVVRPLLAVAHTRYVVSVCEGFRTAEGQRPACACPPLASQVGMLAGGADVDG